MATSKIKQKRSKKAAKTPLRKPHFKAEQKRRGLSLLVDGMTLKDAAAAVGASQASLCNWRKEAIANGSMPKTAREKKQREEEQSELVSQAQTSKTEGQSPYTPKDPGQGLSEHEVEAILSLKKKHPSYGPAQIRAQLKRFKGWRIANKAIARVLKNNGYELVHRGNQPKGFDPIRFEAPRPNAMWQMDYTELRVAGEKIFLLVALDDFSRFAVGHAVSESPSSQVATQLLRSSMARHGKPETVRTDRGGAFVAKTEPEDFAKVLEVELIDHIVGRSYHPQGGGKVESLIGTVKRELWETQHFHTREEAEQQLCTFFKEYNHSRAHMGIDGLTPADKYFGRADQVLEIVNAVSRKRQGASAQAFQTPGVFEEVVAHQHGAPLEVLRLVLTGEGLELRFCGVRVPLGK